MLEALQADEVKTFNAAYEWLRTHIEDAKPYLLKAMALTKNSHAKGALLELLGATKDAHFVPYIANQLHSDDREVRFWAFVALQYIGTPGALRIARDANVY
jgi:hypothetical protein